ARGARGNREIGGVQPRHGASAFGPRGHRRREPRRRPPGAVDAGRPAGGRSGDPVRVAPESPGGAALEARIPRPRLDRAHCVCVASDASARLPRNVTRARPGPITNPLVSVVMPVYNELQTIDEIVRRVLAVPLRIELIVVDDCSTDGTRDAL